MPDAMTLLPAFLACNAAAAETVLPPTTMLWCNDVYLALKLTFVSGVTPESYAGLDAATRADVNREGYTGLRDWMDTLQPNHNF